MCVVRKVNMNEEKLKRINQISEEISKIECFIEREFRTPVLMSILGIEKILKSNMNTSEDNLSQRFPLRQENCLKFSIDWNRVV